MAAEWQQDRTNGHVRFIFGSIVVLFWLAVAVWVRDRMMMEPDLWWHIKTGDWMWRHGALPTADPFSHTFGGEPWIAKEWLSQITFFAAYAAAGWNGVMLVALAALGLGAGALYWALSRDVHPLYAATMCMLVLVLAGPTFTVRPHLLTLMFLIAWTYLLFAASRRHEAPPFGLLLLMVVWANLHAAFTVGLVIAAFAFLDFIERTRLSRKDALPRWLAFLLLCPVVTLIHPYFSEAITATWTVIGPNEAVPLIDEWSPFDAQKDTELHLGLLGMIFLAMVTGFRLGIAKALLAVLLLSLFLTHARFGFFLFPVLAILTAPEIAQQFPQLSARHWAMQPRDEVEQASSRFFKPLAAMIAAAVMLTASLQATVLHAAPKEQVAITSAIAYAKANGMTEPVMNHYDFGGQLIFNDIKTFIDGRSDQLFLGGFTRKFMHGPDGREELVEALQQYGIGWTLFPPGDERVALLDRLPGWRRVYSDEHAVIHLRGEAE